MAVNAGTRLLVSQLFSAVTAPAAATLPVPSALVAQPGTYIRPRPPGPVFAVRNVATSDTSFGMAADALEPLAPPELDGISALFPVFTSLMITPPNELDVARNAAKAVQVGPAISWARKAFAE